MDLQSLFPIAADLPISFPDGTPTDITLKVVGQDSKPFREAAKKVAALVKDGKPDLELLERHGAELTAACITDWSGLTENGMPIPYSASKAVELMSMPELTFIREQVEGFVAKRTNFFRPRAATA